MKTSSKTSTNKRIKIDPEDLMKQGIEIFGDLDNKDDCLLEDKEEELFVQEVRLRYPKIVFTHIKNEGRRSFAQLKKDLAMGMVVGACDIIVAGCPSLCLEFKRANYRKSDIGLTQIDFLKKAKEQGSMVGIALGAKGGMLAINKWVELQKKHAIYH